MGDGPDDAVALGRFRQRIDEIDRKLVELLNERARIVVEIGDQKRAHALPIYAPDREAQVLAKVLALNEGPLQARSVEAIYRELMSASFALEQPLRVAYLGPEGSFSHLAATSHFGSSVAFDACTQIESVFDAVRRAHVDYGLVPAENSIGGGIVESLDAFVDLEDQGALDAVSIYAEALVQIRHNLLVRPVETNSTQSTLDAIEEVHSKAEIFVQCREWLRAHLPNAKLVPAASSAAAVQHAVAQSDAGRPGIAAIGSTLAGERYGLPCCVASIEDETDNLTRFWILARQQADPSGDDKTTVMFRTGHTPGALVEVLGAIARAGVNLTHIEKRPSRRENWSYIFFADLVGHRDAEAIQAACRAAASACEAFAVLGSYPRARRVL